jgi:hypothetical protein
MFLFDASGTGTGCLRVVGVFPVNIIPPVLDTHIHIHVTLNQKANRAKRETLPISNALLEVGGGGWWQLNRKVLLLFSVCRALISKRSDCLYQCEQRIRNASCSG